LLSRNEDEAVAELFQCDSQRTLIDIFVPGVADVAPDVFPVSSRGGAIILEDVVMLTKKIVRVLSASVIVVLVRIVSPFNSCREVGPTRHYKQQSKPTKQSSVLRLRRSTHRTYSPPSVIAMPAALSY
jgi:hypothetical protein